MTDREKLIGILDGFVYDDWHGNGDIASYLISHGVVVRDKGEWIFGHTASGKVYTICSVCNTDFSIREKSGSFAKINMDGVNYCPNCGADMRGEQHDD